MKYLKSKIIVILAFLALAGCQTASDMSGFTVIPEDSLVLVTGITGNQGGGVANALLDKGFKVRGLTRNTESERAKAWSARGVEMVQGDFADYDSIVAAVQGADFMFLNITEQTPNFITVAKHAFDAAYDAGVKHIVFTSNRPADPESGFNTNVENSKRMLELHLRATGKSYTTLRIPFMMENFLRERGMAQLLNEGIIEYGEEGTVGYYMNSGDMGLLAAEAFAHPAEWNGREVNMASDALTYKEVAALLSKLSGLDIAYRVAPWSELRGPFVANFKFFAEAKPSYDLVQLRKEFPEILTLEAYLISQNYGEKLREIKNNPPAQQDPRGR
jgi:uncharacterized protein YbjT (DUF2867 family)